jgi:hypothetical protein
MVRLGQCDHQTGSRLKVPVDRPIVSGFGYIRFLSATSESAAMFRNQYINYILLYEISAGSLLISGGPRPLFENNRRFDEARRQIHFASTDRYRLAHAVADR